MRNLFFLTAIIFLSVSCGQSGKGPVDASQEVSSMPASHTGTVSVDKANVTVDPAVGGISKATLFSDMKKYDGKTVKIKGQVTKVNSAIMGKNWVHIQDGTESDGHFDLTVTTDQSPEIGAVVTFEGTIALDKDFGYGYTYDVLMEDGTIIE